MDQVAEQMKKTYRALPPEKRAEIKQQMIKDVDFLLQKAREWYVSKGDESIVFNVFEKWKQADLRGPYGKAMYDEFLFFVLTRTYCKGLIIEQWTSILDTFKTRFSEKGKTTLCTYIEYSAMWNKRANEKPIEEVSFWNDVVWFTVKSFPGGTVAFAGGAIESLPIPYIQEAGTLLKNQSMEYFKAIGVSEAQAKEIIATEHFVGNLWGQGMQLVVGMQLAATAIKSAEAAAKAKKIIDTVKEVTTFYKDNKLVIDLLFAISTDIAKAVATGKQIDLELFIDRINKQVLSKLGEEVIGKKAEDQALKSHLATRQSSEKAQNLQTKIHRLENREDSPTKKVERLKENAADMNKDSAKSLASYLMRNILRRFIVNLLHEVTKMYVHNMTASKDSEALKKEFIENWKKHLLKVMESTVREVVTDLINNYLLQDLKFAKDSEWGQLAIKNTVDALTKIFQGFADAIMK
jgi:hypothetical protein